MRFDALYEQMSKSERDELAQKLDTDQGYLWQIATRWRGKRPSMDFMERLVEVEPRLTIGELAEEFAKPKERA